MTALLVAAGAAVGAPLRFLLATWLDDADHPVPWGTFGVNVAGSFVLGCLTGAAVGGSAYALLGTGFCGGLTTFSAFAVHTVDRGRRGLGYAAATVVVSIAAAALGFWVS